MGSIVGGVILFVLGAIVAFALNLDIPGVEGTTLGYILMGAGVVLFVVGVAFQARGRKRMVETRHDDLR